MSETTAAAVGVVLSDNGMVSAVRPSVVRDARSVRGSSVRACVIQFCLAHYGGGYEYSPSGWGRCNGEEINAQVSRLLRLLRVVCMFEKGRGK